MKRLIFILIPFVCYGQTFKGLQRTQGNTYTIKPNELFESFPNSLSSNPIQNAIPDGWVAWFDPNQNITLNGSTVSQWCDLSNTYCLTQGVAANQPTYVSGTRPYMSFNGSTTFLSISNFGGVGTNPIWSVFVICKYNSFTNSPVVTNFFVTASGQGTWTIYWASASSAFNNQQVMTSVVNNFYGSGTTAPTANILLGTELNRTAGRNFSYYNSNYQLSNATITTSLTDWSTGTLNIGRYGDGTLYLNGNVYDILIYNRQLTRLEYNSMYSFFKAKYALP